MFVIFVFVLLLISVNCENDSTLKFVHAVWRHGDRSPAKTFKTDLGNGENTWPQGWGELTQLGMQRHYALGQYLRRRYSDYLSNRYSKYEVYIRSTGYNRTIMSALSNMAGLFPPSGSQIWDQNLLWQPIPVHSRPREEDPMLYMRAKCPVAEKLYDELMQSPEVLKIMRANADFLTFLREKTGEDLKILGAMWEVYDPLNCEMRHNRTHKWPSWVNETVFNRIKELAVLSFKFYYHTPEIQRFRGGLLLGEILERMQRRQTETLDSRLKFYVYSAHDTTLGALLENLGAYNNLWPPYASMLLIELHRRNDKYYVELYYKNDTQTEAYPLSIGDCGSPCSLEAFAKRSQQLIPKDWKAECGLGSLAGVSERTWLYVAVGAVLVLLVLCVVLSSILIVLLRRENLVSARRRDLVINDSVQLIS